MKYILLFTFAFAINTHANETFITTELGHSRVDFDGTYVLSDNFAENDAVSATFIAGHKFSSNIHIAGSISTTTSDNFFGALDGYSLFETAVEVGYSFELSEHFRVVPVVGYSRWDMELKEGALLNPGPEETLEITGYNGYWKVNFEFPINSLIVLNAAYMDNSYTFGSVDSVRFGVKFTF